MSVSKFDQISARISNHVRHTLEYCSGVTRESFLENRMLQEACIFNVLQIGELAARAIEYGIDREHPDIPWRKMRGMRNRIVHDYEGVRLDVVWETIQDDFPQLLTLLESAAGGAVR